jgi:hypothetical protein
VVFVLMLFVTEPWESGMKRSTEPEIHPTAVWAKFKSMAEGGRLASREVWDGWAISRAKTAVRETNSCGTRHEFARRGIRR